MVSVKSFLLSTLSVIRALLRLLLVTIIFFLEGINSVIFQKSEVSGFVLNCTYQKEDEDRIAYLEKLNNTLVNGDTQDYLDELEDGEDEGEEFDKR